MNIINYVNVSFSVLKTVACAGAWDRVAGRANRVYQKTPLREKEGARVCSRVWEVDLAVCDPIGSVQVFGEVPAGSFPAEGAA